MKKVFNLVILAIIMLVTLTGCASVNYEITINADGSADISYLVGYNKSFFTSMGVNPEQMSDEAFSEMEEEAKNNGYTIEKYSDDTIIGFKSSKHLNKVQEEFSLKEAFGDEYISQENTEDFKIEKNLFTTKYILNTKIDLSTMKAEESDDSEAQYMNMFLNQIKMNMKINLPIKATSNNATTISNNGKTLEWTLTPGQVNEIKLEATQLNIMFVVGIIIAIILLVVVIVIAIIKFTKKNKGKDNNIDKEFRV